MTPPLLELRNATVWRGDTRVFDKLSLTIDAGERISIIGPNGSGKTTLIKLLNRELYPVRATDAWVRVLGRDNWNVWDLRRQIGILSSDLHFKYPGHIKSLDVVISGFHSSVGVHGSLAANVTPDQTRLARKLLKELGVPGDGATRLAALSTGQQRRVLLARALVHAPETLILDEASAGLDLSASFDLLARLQQLKDTNVIHVTHHVNEIPPQTERVIALKDGKVFADGLPVEVLTSARLSALYGVDVAVARVDGYFLPHPPAQE